MSGDGIMGYIEIPKINVHLPIYHGTGDSSLSKGVGHLLGSSLPVGGASTHSILSGHSGMASQTMFTDLEQLGMVNEEDFKLQTCFHCGNIGLLRIVHKYSYNFGGPSFDEVGRL